MAISFHQARQTILDHVPLLGTEKVPLPDADGRVLAKDIIADASLPAFTNSAMDGFAVRSQDCIAGATLVSTGYLPAGEAGGQTIQPGTAVRIMTGAPLPAGADAVVPLESCREEGRSLTLPQQVKSGDHIRWAGEDVRPGDQIIGVGKILRAADISLLASLRRSGILVYRQARVAILTGGDELQKLSAPPLPGKIVDSNSLALAAALKEIGAVPVPLGIARDQHQDLRQKIAAGLTADALITSAGVSAGDRDLIREILSEFQARELFWKIRIRPGHPTAFALIDKTPIFSLPGNPVSTLLIYEEFVRPALLKMMGHHQWLRPMFKAILTEPLKKKPGRTQIVRLSVKVNPQGDLLAGSAGDQNTGILTTSVAAQGIALLDEERDFYPAGEAIPIHFLGSAPGLEG